MKQQPVNGDQQQPNDVQEVCRILAALNFDGQQTIVTAETFSRPNFPLVCKILKWLARILDAHCVDQEVILNLDCDRICSPEVADADRVLFLTTLDKLFRQSLGVRLNLVSVFSANAASCSELLKVARPVFEAAKMAVAERSKFAEDPEWAARVQSEERQRMADTLDELGKDADTLEEIAASAAKLGHQLDRLLASEERNNEERVQVIDRRLELDELARILDNTLEGVSRKADELSRKNDELQRDATKLDEKLRLKESELEAAKAKLDDLLLQSPNYANQYDKLRNQFVTVYEQYVSNYRNLCYLKSCVYSDDDEDDDADVPGRGSTDGGRRDQLAARLDEAAASKPSAASETSGGARLLRLEDEDEPGDDKGPATSGRARDSDTVGPARLLESLLEADGASKPMSASWAAAEVGPAAGATAGAGSAGRLATGRDLDGDGADGPAGLLREGRANEAGDAGLELEGLLNEFALDESGAAAAEASDEGGDRSGDRSGDESDDDEDDEESGDTDSLDEAAPPAGLAGKY